jgi:hypothetical protein
MVFTFLGINIKREGGDTFGGNSCSIFANDPESLESFVLGPLQKQFAAPILGIMERLMIKNCHLDVLVKMCCC